MVFFYLANLIGYARIVCLFLSLHFLSNPYVFMALYVLSYSLDAIDGPVARAMNQTTKFGAVMDMVTDRCSTALLLALTQKYEYMFLDLSAHWVHMAASMINDKHHKEDTTLSWYYYKPVLFTVCLCSEAYLCTEYLKPFVTLYTFPTNILYSIFLLKQGISLLHLGKGVQILTSIH